MYILATVKQCSLSGDLLLYSTSLVFSVVTLQGHVDLESIRTNYFETLMSTGREARAAQVCFFLWQFGSALPVLLSQVCCEI